MSCRNQAGIPLCLVSPSATSTCFPGWWPHVTTAQDPCWLPPTCWKLLLATAKHWAAESQSRTWRLGKSLCLWSASQVKKAMLFRRRERCARTAVSPGQNVKQTLAVTMSCCSSCGQSPCEKAWLLTGGWPLAGRNVGLAVKTVGFSRSESSLV